MKKLVLLATTLLVANVYSYQVKTYLGYDRTNEQECFIEVHSVKKDENGNIVIDVKSTGVKRQILSSNGVQQVEGKDLNAGWTDFNRETSSPNKFYYVFWDEARDMPTGMSYFDRSGLRDAFPIFTKIKSCDITEEVI